MRKLTVLLTTLLLSSFSAFAQTAPSDEMSTSCTFKPAYIIYLDGYFQVSDDRLNRGNRITIFDSTTDIKFQTYMSFFMNAYDNDETVTVSISDWIDCDAGFDIREDKLGGVTKRKSEHK